MVYCAGKLKENFYFMKAIDHTFYGFDNPLGMLPSARDLEAILVFSQHPASVITPVNP